MTEMEVFVAACGSAGSHASSNSSSSPSTNAAALSVYSMAGAHVGTMRDGSCVRQGLTVCSTGALAAVQDKKGALRFWNWRKEQPQLTCTMPEKMRCIESRLGFIVGGGDSGSAYLWEIATGTLFKVWKAHYRSLTCIRFVQDGSILITAGEDAMVNVWDLGELLDADIESVRPRLTFSEHSLPVMDLWVGYFGANCRVLSCSADRTLQMWSFQLSTVQVPSLKSFVLPCILNCVCADTLETWAFVGAQDGKIYECTLREGAFHNAENANYRRTFDGHLGSVTCVQLDSTSLILVSSSVDGTCRVWDTAAGQSIKVVRIEDAHRPITALKIAKMPRSALKGEKKLNMPALKPLIRYQTQESGNTVLQFRKAPQKSRKRMKIDPTSTLADESFVIVNSAAASASIASRSNGPDSSGLQEANNEAQRWKLVSRKLYDLAVDKLLDGLPSKAQ